jgi:hypothetical protein
MTAEEGREIADAEADDAEVSYGLGQGQQGAAWLISAQSSSMGSQQTVIVNAETGESQTFG